MLIKFVKRPYLLVLGLIILLGLFLYILGSRADQLQRRAELISKPQPIPNELTAILPKPGSQIATDSLKVQHTSFGETYIIPVCFEVEGDLLGLDPRDAMGRTYLSVDGEPIKLQSIALRKTQGVTDELSQACWYVTLSAGDHLVKLEITGMNLTLIYEWAFNIIKSQ